MVRFGLCSSPNDASALAEMGFDYAEWPVRSTVGEMDADAYAELRRTAAGLPLAPEAWNVLLPRELRIVGPDADLAGMVSYLERALSRVAELGGSIVVFGSGESRTYPEGWSSDVARAQLDDAFRAAGEVAARMGVTIVIEPLNRGESNTINSVAEGLDAMRRVNHPHVRLLADLYHITKEGERFTDMDDVGGLLDHVHLCAPSGRSMPTAGRDDEIVGTFLAHLKRTGYDKRISIECRPSGNPAEVAAAAANLRRVWARVT